MLTAIAVFFVSLIFVVLLLTIYIAVGNYTFVKLFKTLGNYFGFVATFVFSSIGSILATFCVAHIIYKWTNDWFKDDFGLIL